MTREKEILNEINHLADIGNINSADPYYEYSKTYYNRYRNIR